MGDDSIDKVLNSRKVVPLQKPGSEDDKFYSILGGDGLDEFYLELKFRIGVRTCFSYTDLQWFNYDPEAGCIDLEFGGFLVTLKGRGLGGALFDAIRRRRVVWVKEADLKAQDHPGNETFISEILITPPKPDEEEAPAAE